MSSSEGGASSSGSNSSGGSSGNNSPSLARSRWELLQEALRKKTIPESPGNRASKRVFERYDTLFDSTPTAKEYIHVFVYIPSSFMVADGGTELANMNQELGRGLPACVTPGRIFSRNKNQDSTVYSVDIYRKCLSTDGIVKDLQGFDKTGRICIWPSEQVLAYWCLKNRDLFAGKDVIELGGGFHCLTGICLAKYSKVNYVAVTDGDGFNMDCVTYSIEANNLAAGKCRATSLLWGEFQDMPELESSFDYVIAADVLYKSSSFSDLLDTVKYVLKPGGQCLLFNPTRNGVLQEFVELAQKHNAFSEVKLNEKYDSVLTAIDKDLYESNIVYSREWHYPQQVMLKKVVNYASAEELVRK